MPPAQGQVQAQGPGPAQKAAPVPAVSSLLPAASAPPGAWLPPAFGILLLLASSSAFLASSADFCLSGFLSSAVLSSVFAASCLPSALVVPVSAVSFFLVSVVCSCVAVGMLPVAYDTVFSRRRRRSAAGTVPAPTAKIGGFSSYLSFLIKAPYAEALSRLCVGCSVVTWKRASSGSAPQRLPPPGLRCPATAPSDCRPPCWRSPSCRCRPYRFRRSSTRRTPSHRRR